MSVTPTKEGLMKWVDDYAVAHDLGPLEALFLSKFAAYADAAAEAWAAVKTLAERARCSERKTQYMLRDFEAAGVIRRTGEMHRLPESTREVPIYAFTGYLESLAPAPSMGARRAPIEPHGCTERGGMGAHTVHPHNEQIEQTPSDEGDAGAREALFERLERAYPKRGLGFTMRPRARAEFIRLLDGGLDAELLIRAAKAFAEDRAVKRTDQGLDHWLADGKYRGWWPEPQLALDAPAQPVASAQVGAAAEAEQLVWNAVLAQLRDVMKVEEFGSSVGRCYLGAEGLSLYVVAPTGWARDEISRRFWRLITDHWTKTDRAKRPLKLVLKSAFEAQLRQQGVN